MHLKPQIHPVRYLLFTAESAEYAEKDKAKTKIAGSAVKNLMGEPQSIISLYYKPATSCFFSTVFEQLT